MPRDRRRMLLTDLLRRGPVPSQEELAEALAAAGEPATQATVSRDLAAIGAVRGPDGYHLPAANGTRPGVTGGAAERDAVLRRHVVDVVVAHALVVLRTAPGHAQLVASALDRAPPQGAAGTVAGDDTVFVATTAPTTATRLAKRLRTTIQGEHP